MNYDTLESSMMELSKEIMLLKDEIIKLSNKLEDLTGYIKEV